MIMETFMLIAGALVVIALLVLFWYISKGYLNEIKLKKLCSDCENDEHKKKILDEAILRLRKKYKIAILFLISASVFGITIFAMNYIRIFVSEPCSDLMMILNLIQALSMVSSAIFITMINYRRWRFE